MGIQYTPPKVEDLSLEMQALIARLLALKNDPNTKPVNLDEFNFKKSQEELADIKESFADLVWEDREGR